MLIDIFKVFILSLIEAFTEFIPVSSTGHMILADKYINLSNNKEFVTAFQVIIQLGAILAVVVIFFKKLYPFMYKGEKRKNLIVLWTKIIVAVLPAVILGLLLDDYIEEHFFNATVVSVMLLIYGILLIFIERKNRKQNITNLNNISYTMALSIGLFQCLAMIPGTSRSAATIIGAMFLGLNRVAATEFSFFLAIPTMLGATALKLIKIGSLLSAYELLLIFIGLLLTFIMSLMIINSFLRYIKKHDFKVFGYYRIIIAILILLDIYVW
ncbi:undecaprenyl-diphosphate phosphatase [Streptobacillus felis]|uniref:Undecaprenyl-diphosphatase n=1 Tax=Streptobacillus felis TaxID=1384509 RepID=A0A7Z0PI41_9FUSO|nr:undecaprenyl-diphosphate phosphatase [Streptobacillus felis]NYV28405.1 undecaprenyl-diphosphate phosphatase [Streptobacillus felis]